ncbi:hypothetical protein J4429_00455 [Candidatus Pacearchaeota archaeon]|nr:hypothetical protein [uncultured archaeon]AQS32565.1 hypothetical protein [uncultured archaeon]AQS33065.1 hypothetical protein [uncultured archaeon]MBS3074908.1 hypothetical protein [Candidatus Pacearchaeota archaeon]
MTHQRFGRDGNVGPTFLVFKETNRVTGQETYLDIQSLWTLQGLELVADESELAKLDPVAAEEARTHYLRVDGTYMIRKLEILARHGR